MINDVSEAFLIDFSDKNPNEFKNIIIDKAGLRVCQNIPESIQNLIFADVYFGIKEQVIKQQLLTQRKTIRKRRKEYLSQLMICLKACIHFTKLKLTALSFLYFQSNVVHPLGTY